MLATPHRGIYYINLSLRSCKPFCPDPETRRRVRRGPRNNAVRLCRPGETASATVDGQLSPADNPTPRGPSSPSGVRGSGIDRTGDKAVRRTRVPRGVYWLDKNWDAFMADQSISGCR